jgi:hypothetical protein
MADLIAAFNGAIPIKFLKGKNIHNRVNKLVLPKPKKEVPLVQGGQDIVLEKVEDESPKKVDTDAINLLKITDEPVKKTEPVSKPKLSSKRKYKKSRR